MTSDFRLIVLFYHSEFSFAHFFKFKSTVSPFEVKFTSVCTLRPLAQNFFWRCFKWASHHDPRMSRATTRQEKMCKKSFAIVVPKIIESRILRPSVFEGRHLGRNHVHLTVRLGFVTQHLWLGDFGKCNRGLCARTLRLCYPKSSVMFPFS